MAIVTAENVTLQAHGFGSLSPARQLGTLVGLALSVALGITVALWSQQPNYVLLNGDLTAREMSQVTSVLDQSNIEYKLEGMGMVMIPADRVQEARMKLAGQGFTAGGDAGYELLDQEQGLGSSSFLQKARLHRAMEGELAKSIGRLSFVEGARVHLAIPKQSAFARKSSNPTASVVLNLMPGRVLDDSQIAGIINMVASAVPQLDSENVSVIDHKGRLLNNPQSDSGMMLSSTQFEYTRKLEERYIKRIIDIISPITGLEGVRAQVVANLDFTSQEQTTESYQPDQKAIRSEQLYEQKSGSEGVEGIPGALTNQPPAGGTLAVQDDEGRYNGSANNNTSRAVRNYELDRTISHTRQNPVNLNKLSVAVVVDYKTVVDKKGVATKEALTDEEVAYITSLVKETVGLDEERGDTLNVVNTSFMQPEEVEPLPAPPIWEQPWVWSVAKQGLGALVVLFLAFGILKPMLANMSNNTRLAEQLAQAQAAATDERDSAGQPVLADGSGGVPGLPGPGASSHQLQEMATNMAKEDPQRVAQVMNNWVASDG